MRLQMDGHYCLRRFLHNDALSLAKHGNNKQIARYLRDSFPHPYTLEQAKAWIQHVQEHEAMTRFAIAHDDDFIGEISFIPQSDVHRFTAEIGFWLSQAHWGQGIMSQAILLVSRYAFTQFRLVRLFAQVMAHNTGSCRVLEKCGYQREGILRQAIFKEGQHYDQHIYARVQC